MGINSFNLCVALSYKSCLIPYHKAIFVLLVAIDLVCANDIVLARIWMFDQFPDVAEIELMQFFLHSLNPLRLQKCFIYLSGL